MSKEEIMCFIDWLYEDYQIVKDCEYPYYGDMSHEDLEQIVETYLKEIEQ